MACSYTTTESDLIKFHKLSRIRFGQLLDDKSQRKPRVLQKVVSVGGTTPAVCIKALPQHSNIKNFVLKMQSLK